MKLILIFILLSQVCFSQTSLDSTCFELINSYRSSMNKVQLKWSDQAFSASQHHTIYMAKENKLSHNENILVNPIDRLRKFRTNFYYVAENILFFQYPNYINLTNKEISQRILKNWKDSEEHHKILLKQSEFGSVSITIVENKKTGIITVWATFMLFDI